ncbi:DEKNAAC101423 [Brettanomyces naardenensis]|uniref:Mitochondrial import inner membrane translocase subunit n=1 Tax=Brettanomyces naardenensis TaxID=13370 RepID=A0A448YI23_BRENA|nr:DEKNAAC101423 [Brettanomyces naardenensis]
MSDIDVSQIQQLDDSSKKDVANFIQQQTSKAKIQNSVTNFTDMCFKKCITSVNGPNLDSEEEACMGNCLNRFLDTNIKIVQMLQSLQK